MKQKFFQFRSFFFLGLLLQFFLLIPFTAKAEVCCDKILTPGKPQISSACDPFYGFQEVDMEKCSSPAVTPAPAPPPQPLKAPRLNIPIPNLKFSDNIKITPGDMTQIPWIGQYISGIYQASIILGGILATIMVMVGGFIWLTAAGNTSRVGQAKDFIGDAFMGLMLLLGAYVILHTIDPRLTILTSLKILVLEEGKQDSRAILSTQPVQSSKEIYNCDGFYNEAITKAAANTNVPAIMIPDIMNWENRGNPRPCAVSPKGAVGVMQVLPSSAKSAGYSGVTGTCDSNDPAKSTGLYNPETNVTYGAKVIKTCENDKGAKICEKANPQRCIIDYRLVAACYNGGGSGCTGDTSCALRDSNSCRGTQEESIAGVTYTRTNKFFECTSVENNYGETREYVNQFQRSYTESEKNYCNPPAKTTSKL